MLKGFVLGVVAVLAVAAAVLFAALPGLSVANHEAPGVEVDMATWLLRHSVPAKARDARMPFVVNAAEVEAGHQLFQDKCETCHAYDGGGKTEIGAGAYPHPPVLRELLPAMTDGEVFYHVRNGIRNTAMPSWGLPDRQVWQLVAYMRHLPMTASLIPV